LGITAEDTSVIFSAADLLANSSDVDGDNLSVVDVTVGEDFGSVVDNGDGTYTFTPADDYSGTDIPLSFNVSDGTATTSGTASIDVSAVADAPILTLNNTGGIPVTLKISGDHYDPNNVEDVGAGSPQFQVFVNGEAVVIDGQSTFTVDAERGDWELFRFEVEPGTQINSVEVKFVNDAWDGKNDNDGDGIIGEDRNLIVDKINIGGEANDAGVFVGGYTFEAEDAYYDKPDSDGYETMPWSGTLSFDTSNVDMTAVASGAEDSAIALDIGASLSDSSESLAVTISGVPDGAVLSAGTDNGDGSWSLTPEELDGLTITPPSNFSGSFDLSVTATSSEAGNSATSSATYSVAVSAVNDNDGQTIEGTDGANDLQGGSGDDTLAYNADGTWPGYVAHNVTTGENVSLSGTNQSSDVFNGGDGYYTLVGTSGYDALFLDDCISNF
ncbi:MAG: tandem-95 repeat protein, partial [Emcibacter sp.]|nr:tandem-95 repeat protein [Emcibacter sp.]